MYCTWCTRCERRFRNSHVPQFWEIDQIWHGHKIESFDPVITTQVLRTRADPNFTYAHILTLRTHFAKPAQNERCFYGQTNMCKRTNIWGNIHVPRYTAVVCTVYSLYTVYCYYSTRYTMYCTRHSVHDIQYMVAQDCIHYMLQIWLYTFSSYPS